MNQTDELLYQFSDLTVLEKPALPREVSDSGILVVFLLNIITFIGCLVFFVFFKQRYKYFFQPQVFRGKSKLYRTPKIQINQEFEDSNVVRLPTAASQLKGVPPSPYQINGYWNWVRMVYRMTDDEIFATYGIDVLTYLQFMRFCIVLFSLLSMFGLLLLLPVNMSGNLSLGLNATYLGNLDSGDFRHWFHFISCYFITAAVLFFAYRSFSEYIRRMHEYRSMALPNNYSALIKGIPEDHRSSEKLLEQFDKFYPGQVVSAHLIYNTEKIEKLVQEREQVRRLLEAAEYTYKATHVRPKHRIYDLGDVNISLPNIALGDEVDSIDHFRQRFDRLNVTIPDEQGKVGAAGAEGQDYPPTHTGFVTFNTIVATNQCAQTEYTSASVSNWRVGFAPAPNDLSWNELRIGWVHSTARTVLVAVLVAALILFWSVPVFALAQLSNLHDVRAVWAQDFVEWVYSQPEAGIAIITRLLPTLLLFLIMLLPIIILRLFVQQERLISKSEAEISAFRKYYAFLIFNVLLLSTLTSQVATIFKTMADNPSGAVIDLARTLGKTLPGFGAFFINYFLNATFASGGLSLSRLIWFFWHFVRLRFAHGKITRAEIMKETCGRMEYDSQYSLHLTTFTIGLAYSSMVPLLLPVTVIYFVVWYTFDSYNIFFVYYEQYDASGKWGAVVYRRVIIGLIIYHFTMFGIFLVKNAIWESFLILPLFILDILVIYYGNKIYVTRSNFVPLDQAIMIQATAGNLKFQNKYLAPVMRPFKDNKDIFFGGGSDSEEEGESNGYGRDAGLATGPAAYGVPEDESLDVVAPGDLPVRTSLDEPPVSLDPDESSLQTAF